MRVFLTVLLTLTLLGGCKSTSMSGFIGGGGSGGGGGGGGSGVGFVGVAHKTADYNVQSTDAGMAFTNLGAEGSVAFNLPVATKGMGPFTFIVATNGASIAVTPNGSDSIYLTPTINGSGSAAHAQDKGAMVTLICTNNGTWQAISLITTSNWSIGG